MTIDTCCFTAMDGKNYMCGINFCGILNKRFSIQSVVQPLVYFKLIIQPPEIWD
jgi:hypothetical protein